MNALLLAAEEHTEEVVHTGEAVIGDFMWVVPLLPFLAFFVILFFGKKLPNRGHEAGIIAIGVSWLLSIIGFIELVSKNAPVEKSWTWIEFANGFELELGMNYD